MKINEGLNKDLKKALMATIAKAEGQSKGIVVTEVTHVTDTTTDGTIYNIKATVEVRKIEETPE